MVCPPPSPTPPHKGEGLSVPPLVGRGFQFLPLWGAKQAELPHGIEQVGAFLTPSPFYGGGLGWGCEVSTCA